MYACAHLANSASLLLPVSNLTNLLAFVASGLSFTAFAALMAPPWLAVVGIEYVIFRWFFADDLSVPAPRDAPAAPVGRSRPRGRPAVPRFALAVIGVPLFGFGLAEPVGVHPASVAAAGALALSARRLMTRPAVEAARLLRAANLPFCAFVFALGIVVLAVRSTAVGTVVSGLVPARSGC